MLKRTLLHDALVCLPDSPLRLFPITRRLAIRPWHATYDHVAVTLHGNLHSDRCRIFLERSAVLPSADP